MYSTKVGFDQFKRSSLPLSDAELIQMHHDMLLIRIFEEKSAQLYGMGKIAGFCHLYIGQEAIVVGMQKSLIKGDSVITGYRDHGHMLACGMNPDGVMAELTGRSGGYSKGKGGSMHMFSIDKGFYGGHGIVGAQVSLGIGLAFAQQYKNTKNVTLAYYGDGAAHQGQVYESYNMAKMYNLPIVFVIENNQYAMGTSTAKVLGKSQLYKRAEGFGIPSIKIDGMNVLEVYTKGKAAIERARNGEGPQLIEMDSYRYRGHSMSDPAKYRTREEVDTIRDANDPIQQLEDYLVKNAILNAKTIETNEAKTREIVQQAADFSLSSPEPSASELYTDILI